MEAERSPEYLRSVSRAVHAFRDALVAFLELHVVNDSMARGIMPAVLPRDDVDQAEFAKRRELVAQAAGRAGAAAQLTHIWLHVQGVRRPVDPITAWATMTKPKPMLESDDVIDACDQMIGRLDDLIAKAEAEAPPTIGVEGLHPLVWGAAGPLWRDGHLRHAVRAAADALIAQVKARTGRNDVPETALWQEAFSDRNAAPGKPRLRWPGDPQDRDVKNMNDGLRQFAPGVQMTIRNTATHSDNELSEQAALEQLAALSLLARWVAACRLEEVDLP